MYALTIDCKNALELAQFYAKLLKWEIPYHDAEWALAAPKGAKQGGYPCLMFQTNEDYVPPVFPDQADAQQQMAHIDFAVNDLATAVEYAKACGATLCSQQFSNQHSILFDPSGHPFCLCLMDDVIAGPNFKLL